MYLTLIDRYKEHSILVGTKDEGNICYVWYYVYRTRLSLTDSYREFWL